MTQQYTDGEALPDGINDAAQYITAALEENIDVDGIPEEWMLVGFLHNQYDAMDRFTLLEGYENFGSAVDYLKEEGIIRTYEEDGTRFIDYDFSSDADTEESPVPEEASLDDVYDDGQEEDEPVLPVLADGEVRYPLIESEDGDEPIGEGPFDEPLKREGEVWEESNEERYEE